MRRPPHLVGTPLFIGESQCSTTSASCSPPAPPRLDERGASAVEYGLLIAGIAALIVVVVFAFGDNLTGIFKDTCDSVTQSSGGAC